MLPWWCVWAQEARADGTCDAWSGPVDLGGLEADDLDEVSGIAASRANPGVLWVIEDSGAGPVLSAVGTDGADLGSWTVLGAQNTDWEDLAIGPCPGDEACECLYVADIGDNDRSRDAAVIWRVPEPDVSKGGGQTAAAEAAWFVYPDGPHDAEALLVDKYGTVRIVTKESGTATMYAFPEAPMAAHPESDPAKLDELVSVDLSSATDPRVTGGAMALESGRMVLRTSTDLFLFDDLGDAPTPLPTPGVPDGEAVGFTPDGSALLLAGEGGGSDLWSVECADFAPDGEPDALPCASGDTGATPGGCGCHGGDAGMAPLVLLLFVRRRARAGPT